VNENGKVAQRLNGKEARRQGGKKLHSHLAVLPSCHLAISPLSESRNAPFLRISVQFTKVKQFKHFKLSCTFADFS
jgi:hypothetical protein